MDFDLSDDQKLLKETVDRFVADTYATLELGRAYRDAPGGWSRANWQALAELGLLGLPFAEADGGFGGGPVEMMIVMEAFGRGLVPEPYFASVVLGGGLLARADPQQKGRHLPALIDGSHTLALAHGEPQARWDLFDVATTARPNGEGFVLDGRKGVVLCGDSADLLVVSARTSGTRRERDGITLFLVPSDTPGLTRTGYPTQDGGRAAEIILNGVTVGPEAVLGTVGQGLDLVEQVIDHALAALAAEAVGIMEALHGMTVEYLKTRKQFGVAIGSFQVLQHRAADMLIAVEQARSMALYAAMMAPSDDAEARRTALSAVKVRINRACRMVGQEAVQLHGGIGMTMEYQGAHYFRRLTVIESLFGDTAHHLRAVVRAGGQLPDAA